MNDVELKKLGEGLRAPRSPAAEPEPQFDSGEIWDLVEGKVGTPRVRELADAALENPELAEAWHLAVEIRNERDRHVQTRRKGFRTPSWMAIAAIAILGVLSPFLVHHFRSTPVLRGSSAPEIQPLGEGATLPRNHFLLRWDDPSKETVSWDLVVMRTDLAEVFQKDGLTRPECEVPEKTFSDLKVGERLLWQVGSIDRDGARSVSKTFVVKLGKEQ